MIRRIFVIVCFTLLLGGIQQAEADQDKEVYCADRHAIFIIAKVYAIDGEEEARLAFEEINKLLGDVCFYWSLEVKGKPEEYFVPVEGTKSLMYGYAPVMLDSGQQMYLLMFIITPEAELGV